MLREIPGFVTFTSASCFKSDSAAFEEQVGGQNSERQDAFGDLLDSLPRARGRITLVQSQLDFPALRHRTDEVSK